MTAARVALYVAPLRRARAPLGEPGWLWSVTAEDTISGARVAVGNVACSGVDATRCAKECAALRRPELTVVAVVVDPTPDDVAPARGGLP